jgi:hypothetical protein
MEADAEDWFAPAEGAARPPQRCARGLVSSPLSLRFNQDRLASRGVSGRFCDERTECRKSGSFFECGEARCSAGAGAFRAAW